MDHEKHLAGQRELDSAVLALMAPLRMEKRVDAGALDRVRVELRALRELSAAEGYVRRDAAATLVSVFGQMLAEARHAKTAESRAGIEAAAWEVWDASLDALEK